MLSARSLVLSFGTISSFAAIIILFTASLTSVGLSIERRGAAVAAAERGYVGGPLAYANSEDAYLGRRYSVRPSQTRTPPSGSPLSAAAVTVVPKPKIVVVNGQQIEIVWPDELNKIDLTADTSSLAGMRSPPEDRKATTTLLAQALSTIAGVLAGLSVGLFLIRWRSVRISKFGLHKSLASL